MSPGKRLDKGHASLLIAIVRSCSVLLPACLAPYSYRLQVDPHELRSSATVKVLSSHARLAGLMKERGLRSKISVVLVFVSLKLPFRISSAKTRTSDSGLLHPQPETSLLA